MSKDSIMRAKRIINLLQGSTLLKSLQLRASRLPFASAWLSSLIFVKRCKGNAAYIDCMRPQLLATAFLLQRMHGASFAAALLEEHGMPHDQALRILADRPLQHWIKERVNAESHANRIECLRSGK